jgi:UDP-glucose 4-epimerase
MAVLVTGGAGYIGSHTCAELLEAGREIIVADRPEHAAAIERLRAASGKDFPFYPLDLPDRSGLLRIFEENGIEAVIHFAGIRPVMDHRRSHLPIAGTVILCEVMKRFGVRRLVFGSSSAVYGKPRQTPVAETAPLGAANRYGRTLLMIEEILRDLCEADRRWSIALLRSFNPAGAHPGGWIGLEEVDAPQHLMPRLMRVAAGRDDELPVFGGDYPTRDGTCVRDYVHVADLAKGHVKALDRVMADAGIDAYNLGSGDGHSVLEVIAAFEKASGRAISWRIVERRPGDAPVICADTEKARRELGWQATLGLDRICEDAWRWLRGRMDGGGPEARVMAGTGGTAG